MITFRVGIINDSIPLDQSNPFHNPNQEQDDTSVSMEDADVSEEVSF